MTSPSKRALIVGAGIAGLAAALRLHLIVRSGGGRTGCGQRSRSGRGSAAATRPRTHPAIASSWPCATW
jgi:hypothetical protein